MPQSGTGNVLPITFTDEFHQIDPGVGVDPALVSVFLSLKDYNKLVGACSNNKKEDLFIEIDDSENIEVCALLPTLMKLM